MVVQVEFGVQMRVTTMPVLSEQLSGGNILARYEYIAKCATHYIRRICANG